MRNGEYVGSARLQLQFTVHTNTYLFYLTSHPFDFGVNIVVSNGQNYVFRFIDIDIDVSMQRVLKRHIAIGLL